MYHNPLSRQVLDGDFSRSGHCAVLGVVYSKSSSDSD
jgi:hypothetical protein